MRADIITIGDELLIGQVIDTNSRYLESELTKIGFYVRKVVTVGDNKPAIVGALDDSLQNVEVVIMTGGLGPTSDDKTKEVLLSYFGGNFITHIPTLELITKFFTVRGREMTERNRKQAEVPESCEPLLNDIGTAPGMLFRKDNKMIFSLPGVTFEMENLFQKEVKGRLAANYKLPVWYHKTILTAGVSESYAADLIKDWESELGSDISLAYLPSPGILRLRLSMSGSNREYVENFIDRKAQELKELIGEANVFGYDSDTLEEVIGKQLKAKEQTVTLAESCTGGYIGNMITSVSGSSAYFPGGIIAYSNHIKVNILGVSKTTIETYGAVSREVVEQMAAGVKKLFNSDYAIATSGIAGPLGGSDLKPVGTTWIAVATPENVIIQRFQFGDNRERNIIRASISALNMLRVAILNNS